MQLSYIATVALVLSSCGQVTVKDEVMYGNKGMIGAVEFHTLTTGQKDISFEAWMQALKTEPMICTSINAFGDVKEELEQLCSVCNCCAADMTKAIDQFFDNMTQAQQRMKE